MDRERLKQVQQSDINEARINEEFVGWIKTSGPWYLLAVLVGIAVYLYLTNIQRAELRSREQAWFEFLDAGMPASLEDVAQRHADIDGMATLARLEAANTYLSSLQTNLAIGSTIEEGMPLTDEDRVLNLDRAQRLYEQVVGLDGGGFGDTVSTVSAYNGLAAVAESRGEVDAARDYYEQAATRAQAWYPILADQARSRAQTTAMYAQDVTLPNPPAPPPPASLALPKNVTPLDIDNILNLPTATTQPEQTPPTPPTPPTSAVPATDDTAPATDEPEAPATDEPEAPAEDTPEAGGSQTPAAQTP